MKKRKLIKKVEKLTKLLEQMQTEPAIPSDTLCYFIIEEDQWCCVWGDFVNFQQSSYGLGASCDEANLALRTAEPRHIPILMTEVVPNDKLASKLQTTEIGTDGADQTEDGMDGSLRDDVVLTN